MLLKADNISKKFDGTQVLKDISLAVEEGEVVAIIVRPDQVNLPYSDVLHSLSE